MGEIQINTCMKSSYENWFLCVCEIFYGQFINGCILWMCCWLHTWYAILETCRQRGPYLPRVATHYSDVRMSGIASQITSLTIVYSTVYSDADQRKHQSSASLAFVREIHRWPVNFPHKGPVTRKMFPFDDVIMKDGKRHRLFAPAR